MMNLKFVCIHVNAELHGGTYEHKNAIWQAKLQQIATMADSVNSGALTLSGNGRCHLAVGQRFNVSIQSEDGPHLPRWP